MKKLFTLIVTLLIFCFGILVWSLDGFISSGPLEQPATLIFAPNTHFTEIADTLAQNQVIAHPFLFKVIVFASGQSAKFKAGEYDFPIHISPREVANMLASGKTVIHHLTVAEGLMTSEIIDMVKHNDLLSGEITLDIKEGELLPETYNFTRGDKRNDILMRMHHAMQKELTDAWAGRADNLPLKTPEEALTLASIVEKETGVASERSRVAAVYINRLNKAMLLQADPTTVYAVTKGKYKLTRALTYDDLAINSPYNTYKFLGLPPGPIANPGKASILATLHPIKSDELFFVATGNGGHNFANTLKAHEANVKKYRESK